MSTFYGFLSTDARGKRGKKHLHNTKPEADNDHAKQLKSGRSCGKIASLDFPDPVLPEQPDKKKKGK